MKNILSSLLIIFFIVLPAMAAENIAGVYKTIDDETGEAKSLVEIYAYQGKMYGRVIKLYAEPAKKAVGIKGDPAIVGLDIAWELEDEGERYEGGYILDPAKGKIYRCEMWRDGKNLIVRGKIGPFGRNQTWVYVRPGSGKAMKPSIPQEK